MCIPEMHGTASTRLWLYVHCNVLELWPLRHSLQLQLNVDLFARDIEESKAARDLHTPGHSAVREHQA